MKYKEIAIQFFKDTFFKIEENNSRSKRIHKRNRKKQMVLFLSVLLLVTVCVTGLKVAGRNADITVDKFFKLVTGVSISNKISYIHYIIPYTQIYSDILAGGTKFISENEIEQRKQAQKKAKEKNTDPSRKIYTKENVGELDDFDKIKSALYTVDSTAFVTADDLKIDMLLGMDMKIKLDNQKPKVLIFHTHSQEAFKDSRSGKKEDTIVGVGETLADILEKKYNIPVYHDEGEYDIKDGVMQRGTSYETMEAPIKKILEKYPSIEVCIDLHRDGVPDNVHLITEVDGKPTAKIMYFNGICCENKNGQPNKISYLANPYIKENLAFSLQMLLETNELYPDFAKKNYIKAYRYSLHMKPKSLLIEAGANTNTVGEVKNAMYPLAEVLNNVIHPQ